MNTDDNNVLDVEDDDQRQTRIQALLEKLNNESRPQQHLPQQGLQFGTENKPPFYVTSSTELLSRVRAFLPQMQASNEALAQRMQEDPDSVNIEHVGEHVDQYIQMNLGLGVFEDRGRKPKDAQDTEMSSASSSSSSEDAANDSDIESDASSEIITSFVPDRIIRPLPRRPLNRPRPSVLLLPERSGGSPAPLTQA